MTPTYRFLKAKLQVSTNQECFIFSYYFSTAYCRRHYQTLGLRLVYPLQKIFLQMQERLIQSISYIWKNNDVRKQLNYMKQWSLKGARGKETTEKYKRFLQQLREEEIAELEHEQTTAKEFINEASK